MSKLILGQNDFETVCLDNNKIQLLNEWDYDRNAFSPKDIAFGSSRKVWWKCPNGHSYQLSVNYKIHRNPVCPICNNREVLYGYNDLETYCNQNGLEYLISEWDYEMNNPITPKEVTFISSKKVWWKCPEGHNYDYRIGYRTHRKAQCPYCNNSRVLYGYNDLETYCNQNGLEYLISEWDYEKNSPSMPKDYLPHSNKKLWWICPKGHSYESVIQNRAIYGFQCPYCSSQKLLAGYNDLQTKRPELVKYWDFDRNIDVTPSDYMAYSNVRVFWKCPDCGYEWDAAINSTKGCPKCIAGYKVSESEKVIFYYLSQFFPDTELTFHASWLGRMEIDVFIPSIKVAIEYDGEFWHKDTINRDLKKSELIVRHDIYLIRIREEGLKSIDDGSYQIIVPTGKYTFDRLDEPLHKLFDIINSVRGLDLFPDIDVVRDWKTILSKAASKKQKRSLLVAYPEIAATWNYEKNHGLKPENFMPGSNKKVWWKCPDCGYEWEELITNRTKRNLPCSRCKSDYTRRLIIGVNDLVSRFPDIAAEWNFVKNGDMKPEDFTYGSSLKVWWKCEKCGNEWQSTISNRVTGYGCPICGRRKAAKSRSANSVIKGKNDFMTLNPLIALQWDYDKNDGLTPDEVSAYSNKMVWWKCPVCENEWQATVASRVTNRQCPYCSNRRFKSGFNDIFSVMPKLKDEWNYAKNDSIDPAQIICTSTIKVWWICSECGREWQASVNRRIDGHDCPSCAVRHAKRTKVERHLKAGQSIAQLYPEISKEWHPEKNGILTPDQVFAKSGQKVWWLCERGHEWEATPNHRANGTGCPICADIERGKAKRKSVINLDTMEVFDSIGEAARKYNTSISALSACLSGRTKRSGNPKCHWSYYDGK